jgi:hypothetical protein
MQLTKMPPMIAVDGMPIVGMLKLSSWAASAVTKSEYSRPLVNRTRSPNDR